jgi:16S rRNA (guanine966-N2)-methyltransferase
LSPPRIIAGKHRGRRLEVPAGDRVRPTAERLREALFSILQHQAPPLAGARFVDLFAGSGAVGLEALSRGAGQLTAVESDRTAAAALRRNVEKLGENGRVRLVVGDATTLVRAAEPADIVYLDPPYLSGLAAAALQSLDARGWLSPATLVIVELAAKEPFTAPPSFTVDDERRYGAGRIVLLRPMGSQGAASAISVA